MFEKDDWIQLDPSLHSPHSIIPDLIDGNSVVMDVGCATGFLGKKLSKKGCACYGIEVNKGMYKAASPFYKKIYAVDIESIAELSKRLFKRNMFDYIIFADILEHTARPDKILAFFTKRLKKDGRIIISLPNIARFEIRLNLFFGKFEYGKKTSLSPDHLRHFTLQSGKELIENSNLFIEEVIPTGLGHKIKIFPTLTAFQFVYICKKKEDRDG